MYYNETEKDQVGKSMDTKFIRQKARDRLTGNWGLSIGVAAVACLLGGGLVGSRFLPDLENHTGDRNIYTLASSIGLSFKNGIFGLAAFILGGVLELGYARFLLKQHDGQQAEFNDLFSQFDRFGAGFAQQFLRNLYTALWTLLLVIPGIVASLSYAMTPFIMAEYPQLTASEAISRSKALMDGHKMDLFVLRLTFIGWDLLAALTLNIGYLALNPYKNAAEAVFYREICARQRYTVE